MLKHILQYTPQKGASQQKRHHPAWISSCFWPAFTRRAQAIQTSCLAYLLRRLIHGGQKRESGHSMTHPFASVYKSETPDLLACRNRLRTYLIARFQAKTEK